MLRCVARGCRLARPLRGVVRSEIRQLGTGLVVPGTPRALKDVAKLDLLQEEEPARISAIWEAFHEEQSSCAGSTIGPEEATHIVERGAESPNFVFPLRREGGHFMLFSQYAAAHQMFVLSFLEDYRKSPEMAQPWASVHLFDDLVTTKSVGLLRCEVVPERLTSAEAEHLLLLVQRYYGTSNYDKVWTFNHASRHFDLDGYIAAWYAPRPSNSGGRVAALPADARATRAICASATVRNSHTCDGRREAFGTLRSCSASLPSSGRANNGGSRLLSLFLHIKSFFKTRNCARFSTVQVQVQTNDHTYMHAVLCLVSTSVSPLGLARPQRPTTNKATVLQMSHMVLAACRVNHRRHRRRPLHDQSG